MKALTTATISEALGAKRTLTKKELRELMWALSDRVQSLEFELASASAKVDFVGRCNDRYCAQMLNLEAEIRKLKGGTSCAN